MITYKDTGFVVSNAQCSFHYIKGLRVINYIPSDTGEHVAYGTSLNEICKYILNSYKNMGWSSLAIKVQNINDNYMIVEGYLGHLEELDVYCYKS